MPTTLSGLAIFVVFLTPGFLNYIQRRRRVPQRSLSSLVEVATFLSISVLTNAAALGIFVAIRAITPDHTPNVEGLVTEGFKYVDPRIGYIVVWTIIVLGISCTLAVIIGIWPGPFRNLTPVIIDSSAWYYAFELGPEGSKVYLGCDMNDGSYIGGYLDWYNTDVDEVADRDIVLAAPIATRIDGHDVESDFQRVVLSARNIAKISVTFLAGAPAKPEGAAG
jgi:hypothetical protein